MPTTWKKHAILNYYHIECLLKNELHVYCKLIKRGFLNKIKNKNDILLLHTTSDNGINMEHCSIEDEFFLEVLEVKGVIEVLKKQYSKNNQFVHI